MAYQYIPSLTPQSFGRHTPREIEERIRGAKLRLLQLWDLGAYVAANVMNSMAKFPSGPMTAHRLLGRDLIPLDARDRPEPVEVSPAPERDGLVLGAGDVTMPDARQQKMMSAIGITTGMMSQDELDLAYAQLDPHWDDDEE